MATPAAPTSQQIQQYEAAKAAAAATDAARRDWNCCNITTIVSAVALFAIAFFSLLAATSAVPPTLMGGVPTATIVTVATTLICINLFALYCARMRETPPLPEPKPEVIIRTSSQKKLPPVAEEGAPPEAGGAAAAARVDGPRPAPLSDTAAARRRDPEPSPGRKGTASAAGALLHGRGADGAAAAIDAADEDLELNGHGDGQPGVPVRHCSPSPVASAAPQLKQDTPR